MKPLHNFLSAATKSTINKMHCVALIVRKIGGLSVFFLKTAE